MILTALVMITMANTKIKTWFNRDCRIPSGPCRPSAPLKVYKYGIWVIKLAAIPMLNAFTRMENILVPTSQERFRSTNASRTMVNIHSRANQGKYALKEDGDV